MDPRVLEAKDSAVLTDDKGTQNVWHEEARDWMSKRPEAKNTGSDKTKDTGSTKVEDVETPEVKAAYKNLLEKTKGLDPLSVADSLDLFGDLAASGANVSKVAQSLKDNSSDTKPDARAGSKDVVSPETAEPAVAGAYTRLLARGFKPVLIIDVLKIGGDVAAIASSPEGHRLFEDLKTLVGHLKS